MNDTEHPADNGSLRFAFYGRDASGNNSAKARALQLTAAQALVEPHGRIVAEYHDAGASGMGSCADRPDASRLLQSIQTAGGHQPEAEPAFDAVVVYDLSRLSRRVDDFEEVRAAMSRAGIGLWTVAGNGPLAD